MRKAAVQSLSTVAHHKPRLLAGRLAPLLPKLYAQTVVDESLIRIVDLGPFKHRIDDGLELRKVLNQVHSVRVLVSFQKCPAVKDLAPSRASSGVASKMAWSCPEVPVTNVAAVAAVWNEPRLHEMPTRSWLHTSIAERLHRPVSTYLWQRLG